LPTKQDTRPPAIRGGPFWIASFFLCIYWWGSFKTGFSTGSLRVDETTLDECKFPKVAAVLAEWNPLDSRADSISNLDGYRIEAIDIIMGLGVFRTFVAPEHRVPSLKREMPIRCYRSWYA
jgi:hypothetical protein